MKIYVKIIICLQKGFLMDEENFNIQIRKFLKKVGISSQREIEKAVYSGINDKIIDIGNEINLTMTLNINTGQQESNHEIREKIKIT